MAKPRKNDVKAWITGIVVFLASTIALDLIVALVLDTNTHALELFGNYPGQGAIPSLLGRYTSYLGQDTLGWLAATFASGAQSLEVLGSVVQLSSYSYVSGYIPGLIELNPVPDAFLTLLMGVIKLLVPLLLTGIAVGILSGTKKQALVNTIATFAWIGIIAIALVGVHVYMNFALSAHWKFEALNQVNPMFDRIHAIFGDGVGGIPGVSPDMTMFLVSISIAIFSYALINGVIMGLVAVGVKK